MVKLSFLVSILIVSGQSTFAIVKSDQNQPRREPFQIDIDPESKSNLIIPHSNNINDGKPSSKNSLRISQTEFNLDPDELGVVTAEEFDLDMYLTENTKFSENYKQENITTPDSYPEIDKINVSNNQELLDLSFDGSGTIEDPIIISNSTFLTNDSIPAISLKNTNLHVKVISNQFLYNGSQDPTNGGIIFVNVSNIDFKYNLYTNVDPSNLNYSKGMEISQSTNISLITNKFEDFNSIKISESANIQIINNEILNGTLTGIEISSSQQIDVAFNELRKSLNFLFGDERNANSFFRINSNENPVNPSKFIRFYNNYLPAFEQHLEGLIAEVIGGTILNSENIEFFNNEFEDAHVIQIENSSGLNFVQNSLTRSWIADHLIEFKIVAPSSNSIIAYNSFISTDRSSTEIDSEPTRRDVLDDGLLHLSGVNFSVFENEIENSNAYGISLHDIKNSIVEHNRISETWKAMSLTWTNDTIIRSNTLVDNGHGIHAAKELREAQPRIHNNRLEIYDNSISGTSEEVYLVTDGPGNGGTAIDLTHIDNSIIRDNVLEDNLIGIGLGVTVNLTILDNVISTNSIGGIVSFADFGAPIDGTGSLHIVNNELVNNGLGIKLKKTRGIHINENDILQSITSGIFLEGGSDFHISNNLIKESGTVGIQLDDVSDLWIYQNIISENVVTGISQFQSDILGYIVIQDNIISNHDEDGAYGLNLVNTYPLETHNISIIENKISNNTRGMTVKGNGFYIHENTFEGGLDTFNLMENGIVIDFGSNSSVVSFNSFNRSSIFHIFIRSDSTNSALISKGNLIGWNEFYDFGVDNAHDSEGLNYFTYNYWDDHYHQNPETRIDRQTLLIQPYEIDLGSGLERNEFDHFPLASPFEQSDLNTNPYIPQPFFNTPTSKENIVDLNTTQYIQLNWKDEVNSNHYLSSNNTKFEASLFYRVKGPNDPLVGWNTIGVSSERSMSWEVTDLEPQIYEIQLRSFNLHTEIEKIEIIEINFGPYSPPPSFLEENLLVIVFGSLLATAGIAYGVTTYRHRVQLAREADVEGRAKDYLDVARRIQEEDS